MSESLIQISNLEFSYDQAKSPSGLASPLLKISQWSLNRGERLFLAGPSGSGKTTFLEIICGMIQPQKGDYTFDGQDMLKIGMGERDKVRKASMSLIFQNFNLVPYLSVEENILLPFWLGYRDERKTSELKSEVLGMLKKLGLEGLQNRLVTQLSQGQQQRVAAVRAFLKRPKLLLADEPTSSLDMDHRESFLKVLFEMADSYQTALIFVSHDRSLESMFDRRCSILDWKMT